MNVDFSQSFLASLIGKLKKKKPSYTPSPDYNKGYDDAKKDCVEELTSIRNKLLEAHNVLKEHGLKS